MLIYRVLWQFILLDVELSSDVMSLRMEEYHQKTMEKIFRSVQVTMINVRGQFKKKLTVYL